jgi:hypothetical protein
VTSVAQCADCERETATAPAPRSEDPLCAVCLSQLAERATAQMDRVFADRDEEAEP